MRIELPGCVIEQREGYILTMFDDGSSSANWPHPDDPSYVAVACRCGFTDLMAYCAAHEACHSLVPHHLFDRPGYVVWMAAHQRKANLAAAKGEERLIYYVQRAAVGAVPVIDPQWEAVIAVLRAQGLCGDPEVARAA